MHRGSTSRIVLRDASRIVEQQKQQHSRSSTAAAAQQQWWRRRRGSVGGELPFGELGCCFVSPLRRVCFVHPGSGPFTSGRVAFYTCYAAAAVMTTVVGGKRTLLPATGTPCRMSRRIHHTASSNVRPVALDPGCQLNHREHDDRSQTLQFEFPSRIFYGRAGFCPH